MQNAFRVLDKISIFGKEYTEITDYAVKDICPLTYYISLDAEVYNKTTGNYIPPFMAGEYLAVNLATTQQCRKIFYLHRILMATFRYFPNCNKFQVNHIDGNKLNLNLNNLEWVTLRGNNEHAQLNNLICEGEHCPWSILTEKDVREICQMIQDKNYVTLADIARKYNVSGHAIADIARGRSWKSVSKDYKMDYETRDHFTRDQVHKICQIFQENKNCSFEYLYFLVLFYFGLNEEDRIRKRIRKLYNRDKTAFYDITSQYDY